MFETTDCSGNEYVYSSYKSFCYRHSSADPWDTYSKVESCSASSSSAVVDATTSSASAMTPSAALAGTLSVLAVVLASGSNF